VLLTGKDVENIRDRMRAIAYTAAVLAMRKLDFKTNGNERRMQ
jgi:hypothetical protein